MRALRSIAFYVYTLALLFVGQAADKPNDVDGSNHGAHIRICIPVSDPQQFTAIQEKQFSIDHESLQTPNWQAAIKRALSHQSGRGYYTLMRLVLEGAEPGEKIDAKGIKLKDLTENYYGGGGTYRTVSSGGFIFLEHINSSRRTNGRDPVQVSAPAHGMTKLWIDVPPNGVLGVVGDVILRRCPREEMGTLLVQVDPSPAVTISQIRISKRTYPMGPSREFRTSLPAGIYDIRFPEFGLGSIPTSVEILPGAVKRLKFAPRIEVVDIPDPVPVHASIEVAGELVDQAKVETIRIDQTVFNSPEWQAVINRQNDVPAIRSGHGQMTLMRVVLADAPPNATVKLTSTKLVQPGQTGGGRFREIHNGDFIVVEHINSTRRRDGRDPVEISSFTRHLAKLYVAVPPRGSLGILGDVIISTGPRE